MTPPAGWYADPVDPSALRWWDGTAWTDRTSRPAPAAPVFVEAPPVVRTPDPAVPAPWSDGATMYAATTYVPATSATSLVSRIGGRDSVPATAIAAGLTPPTCVRHHRAPVTTRRVSLYSSPPPLLYLVILAGLLVFLIVALIVRKTVVAPSWPLCDQCLSDRRRDLLLLAGSLVAWIPAIMLGASLMEASESAGTVAFMLALFGPVLAAFWFGRRASYAYLVGGRVDSDGIKVSFPAGTFPRGG